MVAEQEEMVGEGGLRTQTYVFSEGPAMTEGYSAPAGKHSPLDIEQKGELIVVKSHEGKLELQAVEEVKVYRKRWLILLLSFGVVLIVVLPWMQYVVMGNVMVKYYNVDFKLVEWTTLIFSAMAFIFTVPSAWFANKYGLRPCYLIAGVGAAAGQWVKVLGCWPDRFWALFLGQCIVACCFNLVVVTPPKIAALWFPANELSLALGTGFNGEVIGIAIGCALAAVTMRADWTPDENFTGLLHVHLGLAGAATLLVVAVFFLYESKPPKPPSRAQAAAEVTAKDSNFLRSMLRIIKNKDFALLIVGIATITSVNVALRTLLSRTLVEFFPDRADEAGWLGTILTLGGLVGIMIASFLLDKTKLFKELTLVLYFLTVLILVGFVANLLYGTMNILYFVTGVMGIFLSGLYVPGFEFAIELNYPEPEGNPVSLLNWVFQPASMLLATVCSSIFSAYGATTGLICMIILVVIGFVVMVFVPKKYHRRNAELNSKKQQSLLAPES